MANNSYTFPSVVIQTYMTFTAKRWGQFPTITIVGGATTGQEFCTMDTSFNITIHIHSGVSTMLQVKTAVEAGSPSATNTAVAGDLVSLAITGGHNSDTVTTASLTPLTGAAAPNDLGFYSDQSITALTSSFVAFPYQFIARIITLVNDETSGSKAIAFSFDGINTHGTLGFAQTITWDVPTGNVIFLKYVSAAPAYRLMVKGE